MPVASSTLFAIDPLVRDPGAAERGTLFHEILHRFASGIDPATPQALDTLLTAGRGMFRRIRAAGGCRRRLVAAASNGWR